MSISKKIKNIFRLMELFVEEKMVCQNGTVLDKRGIVVGKTIDAEDSENYIDSFDYDRRTLCRYLDDIQELYPHIVKIKENPTHCFRLDSASTIFNKFLNSSDDVSWLIQIMYESDKNLFAKLEEDTKERLTNISKGKRDIFLFQNSYFDELLEKDKKHIFNSLKLAIKNNEYRDIYYHYNQERFIKNAQCLKLVFMDNNWYVATASEERGFLLLRIAFIERVEYSKKESYQESQLNRYIDYFKTMQNPMTLFGVEKQKAHLLASPKVAKYFKPNMKKFLFSQNFIKENSDGSVEFTLDYTHALEILPFIKRWLPDVEILSPQSLQDKLIQDLKKYLKIV